MTGSHCWDPTISSFASIFCVWKLPHFAPSLLSFIQLLIKSSQFCYYFAHSHLHSSIRDSPAFTLLCVSSSFALDAWEVFLSSTDTLGELLFILQTLIFDDLWWDVVPVPEGAPDSVVLCIISRSHTWHYCGNIVSQDSKAFLWPVLLVSLALSSGHSSWASMGIQRRFLEQNTMPLPK